LPCGCEKGRDEVKKVAIISLYGDRNYGNKLQNYAVQQFFRSFGFDTVLAKTPYAYTKDVGGMCRRLAAAMLNYRKHLTRVVFGKTPAVPQELEKRERAFRDFTSKHIVETDAVVDKYNVKRRLDGYDYYVFGSDQVWNTMYVGADPLFYGGFCEPRRRLSIAASFGYTVDNNRYAPKMASLLRDMRLITVRENTAREYVKALCGRESEVLLDPTLLIEEREWEAVEEPPSFALPARYVFTYFLGQVSPERRAHLEAFAAERGCELISMNDKRFEELYALGPAQFVYLIHHATYVLTDSFHGTAFSVIFRKNVSVLKKAGSEDYMLDRLVTLLGTLKLSACLTDDTSLTGETVDYTAAEEVLSEERDKARRVFETVFREDGLCG